MTPLEKKGLDAEFLAIVKEKPKQWAYRALAGYATRECYDESAEQRLWANRYGLSRAHTLEEREAWSFGFEWVDRKKASE